MQESPQESLSLPKSVKIILIALIAIFVPAFIGNLVTPVISIGNMLVATFPLTTSVALWCISYEAWHFNAYTSSCVWLLYLIILTSISFSLHWGGITTTDIATLTSLSKSRPGYYPSPPNEVVQIFAFYFTKYGWITFTSAIISGLFKAKFILETAES